MSDTQTVKKVLEVEDKFTKPMNDFKKGLGDVATASDKADKEVGEFNTTTEKGGKVSAKSALDIKKLAISAGVTATAVIGATTAIVKFLGRTAEMADEIGKASQRMDVSIEFYQRMTSASEHAGTSITTVETAMRTMLRTMQQVDDGSKQMADTYNDLGIAIYGSNGQMRNQEAIFRETMIALSEMENHTERNALAQKLLGRSASQLAPLFNEGADAVRNYMNANDSAVTVSQEMADSSARYNDAMQTIQETLSQAKNNALEPFIETMADLAESFLDNGGIEKFKSYINDLGTVTQFVTEKVLELDQSFNDLLGIQADKSRLEVAQKELEAREMIVANIKASNSASRRALTQEELAPLRVAQERVEAQKELIRQMNATPTPTNGSGGGSDSETIVDGYEKQHNALEEIFRLNERRFRMESIGNAQLMEAVEKAEAVYAEQLEAEELLLKDSHTNRKEQRTQAKEQELADLAELTEARREMVSQAITTGGEMFSAMSTISSAKMDALKQEFDYEEERIKNSTMSRKKKEKALEGLAKKRKDAEIEQAKRQVAFSALLGATNTALAIQNGIVAITGVAKDQAGGFAIRAGAMLAMAGAVATQIAQVKSAQAQIPKREHGGVMRKDELYEVAERNKDEVIEQGGRSYTIRSSGGRAHPNTGNGGSTTVNMNVSFGAGTDTATIEERLPSMIAKGLKIADRQGEIEWGGMGNFQREIGN